jgi:hypothetical protein
VDLHALLDELESFDPLKPTQLLNSYIDLFGPNSDLKAARTAIHEGRVREAAEFLRSFVTALDSAYEDNLRMAMEAARLHDWELAHRRLFLAASARPSRMLVYAFDALRRRQVFYLIGILITALEEAG